MKIYNVDDYNDNIEVETILDLYYFIKEDNARCAAILNFCPFIFRPCSGCILYKRTLKMRNNL